MNIIIFDLEWNQPHVSKKRIRGLIGEIIQIGAVKLDSSLNETDSFKATIKPVYYTKMNREIKELTLITDEDLSKGIPFSEAALAFKKWCGDECVLLSWGPDDISVLKNNLDKFGLDSSWLPDTYDAQLMFDDREMQEDRQWPLNYALYHYNEKPHGAHNALADVYSTIAVLKHLDLAACLQDDYFLCGR